MENRPAHARGQPRPRALGGGQDSRNSLCKDKEAAWNLRALLHPGATSEQASPCPAELRHPVPGVTCKPALIAAGAPPPRCSLVLDRVKPRQQDPGSGSGKRKSARFGRGNGRLRMCLPHGKNETPSLPSACGELGRRAGCPALLGFNNTEVSAWKWNLPTN